MKSLLSPESSYRSSPLRQIRLQTHNKNDKMTIDELEDLRNIDPKNLDLPLQTNSASHDISHIDIFQEVRNYSSKLQSYKKVFGSPMKNYPDSNKPQQDSQNLTEASGYETMEYRQSLLRKLRDRHTASASSSNFSHFLSSGSKDRKPSLKNFKPALGADRYEPIQLNEFVPSSTEHAESKRLLKENCDTTNIKQGKSPSYGESIFSLEPVDLFSNSKKDNTHHEFDRNQGNFSFKKNENKLAKDYFSASSDPFLMSLQSVQPFHFFESNEKPSLSKLPLQKEGGVQNKINERVLPNRNLENEYKEGANQPSMNTTGLDEAIVKKLFDTKATTQDYSELQKKIEIRKMKYFDTFLPDSMKTMKNPLNLLRYKQYTKDKTNVSECLKRMNVMDGEVSDYMFNLSKI